MSCLLAMSFDFKALIDGLKDHQPSEFVTYAEVSYFCYWKVIHNFLETF